MTPGQKRMKECSLLKKHWCFCDKADRPPECGQYLIAQEEKKRNAKAKAVAKTLKRRARSHA